MKTQSDYWTEHFRRENDVPEDRVDEFLAEASNGGVGKAVRFGALQ